MNDTKSNEHVENHEGLDYRTIASIMTKNGFRMNHSSVRNYIMRIMKKIVIAYAKQNDIELSEVRIDDIARSSVFHAGIADALQSIDDR